MVFRLLGGNGVGYYHVIKICRYTGNMLVPLHDKTVLTIDVGKCVLKNSSSGG